MDMKTVATPIIRPLLYSKIAQRVAKLRHLNMTFAAIAKTLSVSKQLAIIAFRYFENQR